MFALALRSVRKRPGRLVATLLAAAFGSAITMMFNSMHDTAGQSGTDGASAETLSLTGGVVGGYGTLLVFFAIASTLTVNVRQRGGEIALLRSVGATPAQIRRMVIGEAVAVAVAGVLLGAGPALLGGRALLDMFQDTGQVARSVDHVFGPVALSSGVAVTLLASVGAASLAVRRATRAAGTRTAHTRRRNLGGGAALVGGALAVCSTFAMDARDEALMAAPAYGAILLSIGFAVFSPALLRVLVHALRTPITALGGGSGYLTVHNTRQRAAQLSGILMPLITFTGIAVGTLYMQSVENDAIEAAGLTKSVESKNLETLNLVVVGIIVAFACLMLLNSLYASTSYRTGEFGRMRLAGATPAQVLRVVGAESLLLTVAGVFFGTVAGLAGILPFNAVRTDSALPDQGPGIWLGVVAIAVVVTLVTSLGTARHALRTPAVAAVTVAA